MIPNKITTNYKQNETKQYELSIIEFIFSSVVRLIGICVKLLVYSEIPENVKSSICNVPCPQCAEDNYLRQLALNNTRWMSDFSGILKRSGEGRCRNEIGPTLRIQCFRQLVRPFDFPRGTPDQGS